MSRRGAVRASRVGQLLLSALVLGIGVAVGWLARGVYDSGDKAYEPVALHSGPAGDASPDARAAKDAAADAQHNSLQAYLDAGLYPEAAQWFVSARAAGRGGQRAEAGTIMLKEHVSRLAAQRRGADAVDLLEPIVGAMPDFLDGRMLLASAQVRDKSFDDAIRTLYGGRPYVANLDELQRLESEIQQTVAAYNGYLLACCDARRRIALYEQLVVVDPSRTPYHIALAQAYADTQDLAAARDTLALVLHDAQVGAQARTMLAELDGKTAKGTRIPLERRGNQYQVRAVFNGRAQLSLLIDTGASMTVLSADAFATLRASGATLLGERPLSTANGIVIAQIFRITSLALGNRRVDNLDVAVVEQLDESGLAGLLGMDFLQRFEFSIDQQGDVLYLM